VLGATQGRKLMLERLQLVGGHQRTPVVAEGQAGLGTLNSLCI
jgi:hypothetical protein